MSHDKPIPHKTTGKGKTYNPTEKRAAQLMELDPKYCDVIVKRWEDFTGKKATLQPNSP